MSSELEVRSQRVSEWRLGDNLFPRPVEDISLYVHIPFCTSRCRYCNFYFETGWSPRVMDRTLDTILEESRSFRDGLFPSGGPKVRTVYFGGGTPSVIPAPRLDAFLADFRRIWDIGTSNAERSDMVSGQSDNSVRSNAREWAFEANPETTSAGLIEVLSRHGVNRLSLGVQTFDDEILQLLGRRAGRVDAERAIELVASARNQGVWAGALNMDLIVGIPGQTIASVERDVKACLAGGADHVSIYTLTVEEHTPMAQLFHEGLYDEPDPEQVEELWLAADAVLEAAGLHNYEVSNYARPGFESRHNISYWEMKPYLGLGPGAVGTIPVTLGGQPGSPGKHAVARMTNTDAFNYSRPGRPGWEHAVEVLTPRDFLTDHFLTGLRTKDGVDLKKLEKTFHIQGGELQNALRIFRSKQTGSGKVQETGPEKLALTRGGRSVLNPLLHEIMDSLDEVRIPDKLPSWPISTSG